MVPPIEGATLRKTECLMETISATPNPQHGHRKSKCLQTLFHLVCVQHPPFQVFAPPETVTGEILSLALHESSLSCILIPPKHDVIIKAQGKWDVIRPLLRHLVSTMHSSQHITFFSLP